MSWVVRLIVVLPALAALVGLLVHRQRRVSGLVSFVVAVVVLGIQVFTVWYLRDDPRFGRFAATVSLFAAGMLLLVQASDLVLVLVGWEIMGWCSWLLIGHDSERPAAR